MRPLYNTIRVAVAHCPKCKEQLRGNNSIVFPLECSCGIWKAKMKNFAFTGEYEIIKGNVVVFD